MQDRGVEPPTGLAERIQAGDRDAENELVQYFSPRVYAMLCARTRDREASRDLLQDVLIGVLTALRQGQLRDPEKLPAYILSVARNTALSYLRGRTRSGMEVPLDEEPVAQAAADTVEASERHAFVRQALMRLDSTDREILLRTLAQGQKPGVIAPAVGLSAEAVRQRKSRAIKKVAEYVKKLSRKAEFTVHS